MKHYLLANILQWNFFRFWIYVFHVFLATVLLQSKFFLVCGEFQKQLLVDVIKIGHLKNFANFTEKHLCWSLFLIKLQAFRPVTLLKRKPNQVFSCEICEMFKNTFFTEHIRWLLLKLYEVDSS